MAAIDDLEAQVSNNVTVEGSAKVLIDGFAARLANEVKHLKAIIGNMAPPPLPEHKYGARQIPAESFKWTCVHCGSPVEIQIRHP